MNIMDSLIERNAEFVNRRFNPDLKIMPSKKTMIIACVDPRVDPVDIFNLVPGEVAVIRNVGGRIEPATLRSLSLLRSVVNARSKGGDIGAGWNLVLLQHTDCGIADCQIHAPEILAKHFAVESPQLDVLSISDPYKAVALDIAALQANPNTPPGLTVTGMVYDVATGRAEVVVPSVVLHPQV